MCYFPGENFAKDKIVHTDMLYMLLFPICIPHRTSSFMMRFCTWSSRDLLMSVWALYVWSWVCRYWNHVVMQFRYLLIPTHRNHCKYTHSVVDLQNKANLSLTHTVLLPIILVGISIQYHSMSTMGWYLGAHNWCYVPVTNMGWVNAVRFVSIFLSELWTLHRFCIKDFEIPPQKVLSKLYIFSNELRFSSEY